MSFVLVFPLLSMLAFGCGGGGTTCAEGEVECDGVCIAEIAPTLQGIQDAIFAIPGGGGCATSSACHTGDARQAEGLSLVSIEISRTRLVNKPSKQDSTRNLVTPFDADNSYLVNKLEGTNLANATTGKPSSRMPLLRGALCDAEIDAVREWIDSGAF